MINKVELFLGHLWREIWWTAKLHYQGVKWKCPDCGFDHIQTPDRWQYCPSCYIETGARVAMRRRDP